MKNVCVTKDDPNGCFQRALPDEPVFTLLARDPDMPRLVRLWADKREAAGKPDSVWDPHAVDPNKQAAEVEPATGMWINPPHPDADQIAHARYVAARAEVWRYENEGAWRQTVTAIMHSTPVHPPSTESEGWMPPARHPGAGQDDMAMSAKDFSERFDFPPGG